MLALTLSIFSLMLANAAPPLGFLPNIIIFYADDYGWGDMESYGHPMSITPNLDKLAKEGTKLTAFYSSSPVCSPSRAALLTGRFQTRSLKRMITNLMFYCFVSGSYYPLKKQRKNSFEQPKLITRQ